MKFNFHHIGIACNDIEKTAKCYSQIGETLEISQTMYDPIQNVQLKFLSQANAPLLEFVAPVDDKSPVKKILEKNGVIPYHICYEVDDMEIAINELKKQKFVLVSKPEKACALENRNVCFLFSKNTGLIELLEAK